MESYIDESALKEQLKIYAQEQFHPPKENHLSNILPDMLHHIGTTDAYLRDDLIYATFATWILEYNALSQEQLHNLLHQTISKQQMFYHIGEQANDSVFRRSFSVLLLPLLLITHRSQPFLTPTEINLIKDKLISYLNKEKDRRGFVKGKGWAHAIAHTADAIDDLAQCAELTASDLMDILNAILIVICVQDTGYIYGEDERMVTAVIAIIKRGLLSEQEFNQWIEQFADAVSTVHTMPQEIIIHTNVKNFLQSLYFRLQWEQITDRFNTTITRTLRNVSLFTNDGTN